MVLLGGGELYGMAGEAFVDLPCSSWSQKSRDVSLGSSVLGACVLGGVPFLKQESKGSVDAQRREQCPGGAQSQHRVKESLPPQVTVLVRGCVWLALTLFSLTSVLSSC